MTITKIVVYGTPKTVVHGSPTEKGEDFVWEECSIDDTPRRACRITVRTWLTDGHPLTVYLSGSVPLYPTVVYDENGELRGFSPGVLGLPS